MKITIAPLSTPECLTIGSLKTIENADRLFLQTEKHPYAKILKERALSYVSMDDLYDNSEDFDELNAAICERLLNAGTDCIYATTGEIAGFTAVLKEKAESRGIGLKILPGISLKDVLFSGREYSSFYVANGLPETLDPACGVVITEIDSVLAASDVKLFLSEYYPDEWQIELAHIKDDFTVGRFSLPLCELDRHSGLDATCGIFVPACPFEKLERYGLGELEHVMQILRRPDGCPWDKEQTHESIKMDLIEESYEVIDAINNKDDPAFVEELGDVLMQVVFHSEIATEQSRFTMRDVTTGIVDKLIYRHPHIFSDVVVSGSDEVLKNWDALKQAEKKQNTVTDTLKAVPNSFPALMRARKIQKRAAKVGFDWPDAKSAFPKIAEETAELQTAMRDDSNIDEELGDLLFSVVNIARLLKIDPEQCLRDAADKFVSRFEKMENLIIAEGKDIRSMTLEEMDTFWDRAKRL